MKDSKIKTIAKVVSIVLIVLLLAAVVGVVFKYTNGFTDDFKTFYVEYDGKVLATTDKVTLVKGETAEFFVKYTFDSDEAEARDFTVKILSSADEKTAFDYKVSGTRYSYTNNLDLTDAFEIEQGERGFTLTAPNRMGDVLKNYHGGKAVELEEPDMKANAYFKIIVTPYNGKSSITLSLLFKEPAVDGVELDRDTIVFSGATEYDIWYDTLGSGSVLWVKFECVASASAGEKVTFKVSLNDMSNEYDDYTPLEITNVVLRDADTGEDDLYLGSGEGTYTFTMPAHDVNIVIYLMPK